MCFKTSFLLPTYLCFIESRLPEPGLLSLDLLAIKLGLLFRRRVENTDAVPGPRQLPSQQTAQQARAGDADGQTRARWHFHAHQDSSWMGM